MGLGESSYGVVEFGETLSEEPPTWGRDEAAWRTRRPDPASRRERMLVLDGSSSIRRMFALVSRVSEIFPKLS